eukprot:Opistho-2@96454
MDIDLLFVRNGDSWAASAADVVEILGIGGDAGRSLVKRVTKGNRSLKITKNVNKRVRNFLTPEGVRKICDRRDQATKEKGRALISFLDDKIKDAPSEPSSAIDIKYRISDIQLVCSRCGEDPFQGKYGSLIDTIDTSGSDGKGSAVMVHAYCDKVANLVWDKVDENGAPHVQHIGPSGVETSCAACSSPSTSTLRCSAQGCGLAFHTRCAMGGNADYFPILSTSKLLFFCSEKCHNDSLKEPWTHKRLIDDVANDDVSESTRAPGSVASDDDMDESEGSPNSDRFKSALATLKASNPDAHAIVSEFRDLVDVLESGVGFTHLLVSEHGQGKTWLINLLLMLTVCERDSYRRRSRGELDCFTSSGDVPCQPKDAEDWPLDYNIQWGTGVQARAEEFARTFGVIRDRVDGDVNLTAVRPFLLPSRDVGVPTTSCAVTVRQGSVFHVVVKFHGLSWAENCLREYRFARESLFDDDDIARREGAEERALIKTRFALLTGSDVMTLDALSPDEIGKKTVDSKLDVYLGETFVIYLEDAKSDVLPIDHMEYDRIVVREFLAKLMHFDGDIEQQSRRAILKSVTVYAPCSILDNSTRIIDAPGLNDPDPLNMEVLRQAEESATSLVILANRTIASDTMIESFLKDSVIFKRLVERKHEELRPRILLIHSVEKTSTDVSFDLLKGGQATTATHSEMRVASSEQKLKELIADALSRRADIDDQNAALASCLEDVGVKLLYPTMFASMTMNLGCAVSRDSVGSYATAIRTSGGLDILSWLSKDRLEHSRVEVQEVARSLCERLNGLKAHLDIASVKVPGADRFKTGMQRRGVAIDTDQLTKDVERLNKDAIAAFRAHIHHDFAAKLADFLQCLSKEALEDWATRSKGLTTRNRSVALNPNYRGRAVSFQVRLSLLNNGELRGVERPEFKNQLKKLIDEFFDSLKNLVDDVGRAVGGYVTSILRLVVSKETLEGLVDICFKKPVMGRIDKMRTAGTRYFISAGVLQRCISDAITTDLKKTLKKAHGAGRIDEARAKVKKGFESLGKDSSSVSKGALNAIKDRFETRFIDLEKYLCSAHTPFVRRAIYAILDVLRGQVNGQKLRDGIASFVTQLQQGIVDRCARPAEDEYALYDPPLRHYFCMDLVLRNEYARARTLSVSVPGAVNANLADGDHVEFLHEANDAGPELLAFVKGPWRIVGQSGFVQGTSSDLACSSVFRAVACALLAQDGTVSERSVDDVERALRSALCVEKACNAIRESLPEHPDVEMPGGTRKAAKRPLAKQKEYTRLTSTNSTLLSGDLRLLASFLGVPVNLWRPTSIPGASKWDILRWNPPFDGMASPYALNIVAFSAVRVFALVPLEKRRPKRAASDATTGDSEPRKRPHFEAAGSATASVLVGSGIASGTFAHMDGSGANSRKRPRDMDTDGFEVEREPKAARRDKDTDGDEVEAEPTLGSRVCVMFDPNVIVAKKNEFLPVLNDWLGGSVSRTVGVPVALWECLYRLAGLTQMTVKVSSNWIPRLEELRSAGRLVEQPYDDDLAFRRGSASYLAAVALSEKTADVDRTLHFARQLKDRFDEILFVSDLVNPSVIGDSNVKPVLWEHFETEYADEEPD